MVPSPVVAPWSTTAAAVGRQRFDGDDDRHPDVDDEADASEQDRDEPEDADEGRIEVEELGDARGDPGQDAILAAAIETAVHLHPPIGLMSTAPNVTWTVRSARWGAVR